MYLNVRFWNLAKIVAVNSKKWFLVEACRRSRVMLWQQVLIFIQLEGTKSWGYVIIIQYFQFETTGFRQFYGALYVNVENPAN